MRYDRDHKIETRKRVIEVAARRFRKDGIDSTAVADLMADAGLTHGGFYGHFPSKEVLVQEAVSAASSRGLRHLNRVVAEARSEERDPFEALVRDYLSVAHRDQPERGCTVAALGPELARHPCTTRKAMTDGVVNTIALLASVLPPHWSGEARESTATAVHAMMIGTLQLARGAEDAAMSQRILDAGIAGALALGKTPPF